MQPEIQGRDAEAPPRDMLVTCGLRHIISGKMNCLKRLIYLSIFVILDSINWHMNKEYTWVIGENERATAWFRGG